MPFETSNLLKLSDVADILACHEMTVRRMVKRGTLPAFLAGGRYRIRKQDLQAYIKNGFKQAPHGTRGQSVPMAARASA